MRVNRRRVIVTGGASGIGRASVERFLADGARVAVLDRDPTRDAIAVDVGDEAQVERAMAEAVDRLGGLDVLVNCAGIAMRKVLGEQDAAGWDEVQRVNVRGTYLCTRQALPHMMNGGGSIVHLSSVVGVIGMRNRAAYSASKGAIVAMTRNMALDYCVCPGLTRTPMTEPIFHDTERVARLTALHPLGRLGDPRDIAAAIVFLASGEASWITGVALPVDGGFTAGHPSDA
jgi:NAD(P)-dependent dehydrogenase (short-subunit alcohol dehydrogenase family)